MEEIKAGYTRVSEVLSMYTNFQSIPPDVLQKKSELGTAVHKVINAYLEDIPTIAPLEAEGYVQSFEKWFNFVRPEVVHTEHRMYCDEYMLTGAFDASFIMPGEELRTIVDWKTTASSHDPIWRMQAGFYHYLATLETHLYSDRVLFLKLDKNGNNPLVKEFTIDEWMYELCLNSLEIYRYFERYRGKV